MFRVVGVLVRHERANASGGSPYVNWEIQYMGGTRAVDIDVAKQEEFRAICNQTGEFQGEIVRREWRDKSGQQVARDAFSVRSFKPSAK